MGLHPPGIWFLEGRKMARWDEASRAQCVTARARLAVHLADHIPRSCTHLKGHGSVKGAIRTLQRDLPDAPFVARFDIASYYQSMRHDVLLGQLRATGAGDEDVAVVRDYLALPDTRHTGRGMVASGGLSPLLGGLYLAPLDHAMDRLKARGQLVEYVRYMDDVVLLAKSRWPAPARHRRASRHPPPPTPAPAPGKAVHRAHVDRVRFSRLPTASRP